MTAPNMATITASLQNFSLNGTGGRGAGGGTGFGRSSSSDDVSESHLNNSDDGLELNSDVSLPCDWEQCLDLKTGEIYYVNRRTGTREEEEEDPRVTAADYSGTYYCSDEDEGSSSKSNYDSEESSSESSPSSYSSAPAAAAAAGEPPQGATAKDRVLVVGGCKACLMYYMVPKQVKDCPKCSGRLLHIDRSEDGSL